MQLKENNIQIDFQKIIEHKEIILSQIDKSDGQMVYSLNQKCKRQYNEDRGLIIVNKHFQVYAVFDGHGGKQTSQYVRDYFFVLFNMILNKKEKLQNFIQIQKAKDITNFIQFHIDRLQAFICQNVKQFGQSGSTINMVISLKELFFCINLGDSRCIGLMKKKNKIEQLTTDHKPYSPLEQNKNWTHEDDRVNGILAMSRSIGDCSLNISRKADIFKYQRKQYYMLHIATDGVYDVLQNQEIFDRVLQKIQEEQNLDKDYSNPLVYLFKQKQNEMEDNSTSILIIQYI